MELSLLTNHQTLIASLIAALIAYFFNRSKINLDKDVFKRELFLRYNEKYDQLNNNLEKLLISEFNTEIENSRGESQSLEDIWEIYFDGEPTENSELIASVYDYINLCSEEYYWYKKGFIDKQVWHCWHKGMQNWYTDSFFIKKIIEREIEKKVSYYNEDFLDLFKK